MNLFASVNLYLLAVREIWKMPKDTVWRASSCDVLFFAKDVDRGDTVDGLAVCRVLDPLQKIFEDDGYSCHSIAYPGSKLVAEKTRLNVLSFSRAFLWHQFRKSLNLPLVKLRLKPRASLTPNYEKVFRKVLQQLQPKLVLVIGADPDLCVAAARLTTPILEVLHGRGYGQVFVGWDHGDSSELPDGVLAYDDLSLETFGRLLPTLRVPNFRLPFELAMARQFLHVSPPPFSEVPNHYRHVILFTASYNTKEPSWPGGLPTELVELVRENRDMFLFVRLHPVMRLGPQYAKAREAIERELRALPNCDSEWATTAPIYAVLQHTTCHVTYQSASSYEAADLGLVTFAVDAGKHIPTGGQYDLRKSGYVVDVDSRKAEFSRIIESPRKTRDAPIDDEVVKVSEIIRFARASSGSRRNC